MHNYTPGMPTSYLLTWLLTLGVQYKAIWRNIHCKKLMGFNFVQSELT